MALACCISGLVAAACASNAPTAILADTSWTVASLNGEPVAEGAPTIEFSGDRISGSGGCNRYFGGYEVTGAETIVIRGVGSTEMACEPTEIMSREQAYFTALSTVRSYRLRRRSTHAYLLSQGRQSYCAARLNDVRAGLS